MGKNQMIKELATLKSVMLFKEIRKKAEKLPASKPIITEKKIHLRIYMNMGTCFVPFMKKRIVGLKKILFKSYFLSC